MSSQDPRESMQPPSRAHDAAVPGFSKLDVAGFILAFVLPVLGLIVGVILLNRPHRQTSRHGLWIIAISIVVGALFVVALIASSHGIKTSETE